MAHRCSELPVLCPYLLTGMNGINATREDPSAPLQNLHRMRIRRKVRLLILYNKSKHTEKHFFKKVVLTCF